MCSLQAAAKCAGEVDTNADSKSIHCSCSSTIACLAQCSLIVLQGFSARLLSVADSCHMPELMDLFGVLFPSPEDFCSIVRSGP